MPRSDSIISCKAIKRPRKNRVCAVCYRLIDSSHLRLFGRATEQDSPYVVHVHPGCYQGNDDRVLAAVKECGGGK